MENNSYWRISGMAISGDLKDTDSPYQYGEKITDLINDTYQKILKKKINNPQQIIKLVNKYDNIPAFKNYLVVFYINKNNVEKAASANRWLVKEHPDYLFGKLNLCSESILKEELEQIPKILGEQLDLQDLYPERKIFHFHEFISFYNIACRYLIGIGDLEVAESYIGMMIEVLGEDDELIHGLVNVLIHKKQLLSIEDYIPALKKRYKIEENLVEKPLPVQIKEWPVFENELVKDLYAFDIGDNTELIEKVLQLPKESLVNDLEKILLDASQRLEYFEERLGEEGWNNFPCLSFLHAIALLTDLEAKDKIPLFLQMLAYDERFVDFWLHDHSTETTWQFIYRLYQDDLQSLKPFFLDPELIYESKLPIIQAIAQIASHQPERKKEVIHFLDQLLDLFLEKLDDPRISDFNTVTLVVTELVILRAKDSLPKIKIFFDLDFVEESMCGDYTEVEKDILNDDGYAMKLDLSHSAIELYNHIASSWSGYRDKKKTEEEIDSDLEIEMTEEERAEILRLKKIIKEKESEVEQYKKEIAERKKNLQEKEVSNKILKSNLPSEAFKNVGRNEPCPCGSGKKYKRCCLGK